MCSSPSATKSSGTIIGWHFTRRHQASRTRQMRTNPAVPQTIDEYIAMFSADIRALLQKVRVTIRKAAPNAEEAIKYQLPTFVLHGNLVHFGAFKQHIGFYA